MRSVQEDAWAVIEQLKETHPDEAAQVIVVAPALTVHAIVLRSLGMPLESYRKLRVDPASLSTLAFRQNRTILASLNEACFLDR
jgi:broad specificity phosphatase PhoE